MQAVRERDEQARVTRCYDRLAPVYEAHYAPLEWFTIERRRHQLVQQATGTVLEAGIGTGLNLRHYPAGVSLVGTDVAARMLARTRRRAHRLGRPLVLTQADVRRLPCPDASFDTVVATFLFCSTADPVRGLAELGRVVKPTGSVLLLEHVRPRTRLLGWLADAITPATRRLLGFHVNRRTEADVPAAGLTVVSVRSDGIWREIVARAAPEAAPTPDRSKTA